MTMTQRPEVRLETESYNLLVAEGGRPSHPISSLEDVVRNPGQYREILSFWQDHPDDWMVFGMQLCRWREFRRYQQSMRRSDRFVHYAIDVKTRLGKHNFTLPLQLNKVSGLQDQLTTWIEYLGYTYKFYDRHIRVVKRDQSRYDNDWKIHLVNTKAFDPSETYESICATHSLLERVQEEDRKNARRKDFEDDRLASAALKEQTRYVTEFMAETTRYRGHRNKAERCILLLRWILEQIPLIEPAIKPQYLPKMAMYNFDVSPAGRVQSKSPFHNFSRYDSASLLPSLWPKWRSETFMDLITCSQRDRLFTSSLDDDGSSATSIFHLFRRLPNEIRFQIWTDCLPPYPTVHFFNLINHPLSQHHQHLWSNREFRICASSDHDSGYLHVLPLMSTCKEARAVVAAHYRKLNAKSCVADRKSHGQISDSNAGLDLQRNLAPFDWIPPDDLVVLCLPPRQNNRFPASHDITLADRSQLAFAIPTDLLYWDDILAAPPLLLSELTPSKLPRTYLLSGLQAFVPQRSKADGFWIQRKLDWMGSSGDSWWNFLYPWRAMIEGWERLEPRPWCDNRNKGAPFWWVGGDGNTALKIPQNDDQTCGFAFSAMFQFLKNMESQSQRYGWEKSWDMAVLGWIFKDRI